MHQRYSTVSASIAIALLWLIAFSTVSGQVVISPPRPNIVISPPDPLSNKPTTIAVLWDSSDGCFPSYVSHEIEDNVITVETDFSPTGRECIPGAVYSGFYVDAGTLPAGSYKVVVRGEFEGTPEEFGSLTFDVVELDSVLFLPAVTKPPRLRSTYPLPIFYDQLVSRPA